MIRSCRPSHSALHRLRVPAFSARRLHQVPLWIHGEPTAWPSSSSSPTFDVHHPTSGVHASTASTASPGDLERALASSAQASPVWARTPAAKRRDVLLAAARLLEERRDEMAKSYAGETAVGGAILYKDWSTAIGHIKEAAALATFAAGDLPQTADGSLAIVTREPFGPVLSIAPFNFGLTLAIRAIAYPLAFGNTVLLKGSPLLPHTHHLLGRLFTDAGLPAGALNILQFSEASVGELTEQAIADPRIRLVTFTGSHAVGSSIGELCGRHVKPAVLELGGKAAALVLSSADLEAAAHVSLFGAMLHSGQICMSTERVIVQDDIAPQFEEILLRKLGELRVSAVEDEVPSAGGEFPIATSRARNKLEELVRDAVDKGAEAFPPLQPVSHAAKFPPTVVMGITPSMRLASEESFGPVLTVQRARSAQHAVEIANAASQGLASSVWGQDVMQALGVARQLEASLVHINSSTVHDEPTLPHGGHKASGFGRFNGRYAIDSFTQTKTITLRTDSTGDGASLPPWKVLSMP